MKVGVSVTDILCDAHSKSAMPTHSTQTHKTHICTFSGYSAKLVCMRKERDMEQLLCLTDPHFFLLRKTFMS